MKTSHAYFTHLGPVRRGPLAVPVRLVRLVLRRRRLVPSPGLYLLAAIVGLVVGAGTDLLFGWSWWLVAAAFVGSVAAFFLSTAFWGRPRVPTSLADELMWVASPRRARLRQHRRSAERFRAAPFPLYGLPPSWPGARYLATTEPTALGLGHVAADAEGTVLEVEVRDEGSRGLYAELAERLWLETLPDLEPELAEPPEPAWSSRTIPVDGEPVAFDWLGQGESWCAVAEVHGRAVVLQARDLPVESVRLVRVGDLEPYVEGSRP